MRSPSPARTYVWWSTTACPGPVEPRGEVGLGHRHPDAHREALAERPRRRLDARGVAVLRVAGGVAPPLAELLQLVEREVVAREVEEAVEERRAVAGREHEAVAVGPARGSRGCASSASRRASSRRARRRAAGPGGRSWPSARCRWPARGWCSRRAGRAGGWRWSSYGSFVRTVGAVRGATPLAGALGPVVRVSPGLQSITRRSGRFHTVYVDAEVVPPRPVQLVWKNLPRGWSVRS